jgi:hypothetical protein
MENSGGLSKKPETPAGIRRTEMPMSPSFHPIYHMKKDTTRGMKRIDAAAGIYDTLKLHFLPGIAIFIKESSDGEIRGYLLGG